jgi:hypothetical protein
MKLHVQLVLAVNVGKGHFDIKVMDFDDFEWFSDMSDKILKDLFSGDDFVIGRMAARFIYLFQKAFDYESGDLPAFEGPDHVYNFVSPDPNILQTWGTFYYE